MPYLLYRFNPATKHSLSRLRTLQAYQSRRNHQIAAIIITSTVRAKRNALRALVAHIWAGSSASSITSRIPFNPYATPTRAVYLSLLAALRAIFAAAALAAIDA